jgi:two-component system, LytTR family, response regulator
MKKITVIAHQLVIPARQGYEIIDINSIVRIEAINSYSKLYLTNGKTIVLSKMLRWFEEQLASQSFIRTHRTHLINRNSICYYINGMGGKVKLLNGEWIDVSKRKKAQFLLSLENKAA